MNEVRIVAVPSEKGRRIMGRFLPGTDLVSGVIAMCEQTNVICGTVSIIGSLQRAEFLYATPDESGKLGFRMEKVSIEGPLELAACQGIIGQAESGELNIHLHGVVMDWKFKVLGGHFTPNSTFVLGTGEVVIDECSDVQALRQMDEENGMCLNQFYPRAK